MKIEITSSQKLPRGTESKLNKIIAIVPREHLRGLDRIKLVDKISDPRLKTASVQELPGLYHPRQGMQPAWIELSTSILLPSNKSFIKNFLPRLQFYNNLAALTYSHIGQHYYLTLKHSIKRGQVESAVRSYTLKNLKSFNESEHRFRARVFKPLQPTFERWSKSLQKNMKNRTT